VIIRAVEPQDAAAWERMRAELWPADPGEHAREIAVFFSRQLRHEEALIALDDQGRSIGFVELSIRPYAEGCYSGRVGYLEGWFVKPPSRRRGIGRALVRAAEDWARAQGCIEFASDTELGNASSAAAHLALGFSEVERIICFRKPL